MTTAPDYGAPDNKVLIRALRQARHIAQCYGVDLDRARLELAATHARAAAFARQQEVALLRVNALEQAVGHLEAQQARLTALLPPGAMESPTVGEASLRAEIALLAQHRDEAHRLRQSLSWRVTRPLRALRQPRRTLRLIMNILSRSRGFG